MVPLFSEFLALAMGAPPRDGAPDLDTVAGIQTALRRLGYDCGPSDGIWGPRSIVACKAFQTERGLKPDAIVGPLTKAALRVALTTAA